MPETPNKTLRWSNWAGNQRTGLVFQNTPETESELQQLIQSAAKNSQRVKAVGSGHSFTGIALAEQQLIDLSKYGELIAIDKVAQTVTVQSGMAVSRSLN